MKLLLVAEMACRASGADVYTEELALGLSRRGHQVDLACRLASGRVAQQCEVHRAHPPDYDGSSGWWRISPYLRRRFWANYCLGLQGHSPDAIICSKSECMRPLARRWPATPLVYLPHWPVEPAGVASILPRTGPWLQSRLAWGLAYRDECRALRIATSTVRFTQASIDYLRKFYRLPLTTPFRLIPPGVQGPAVVQLAKPSELRLLVLGRLVESKNVALALACLATHVGDVSWRLDIVGDGPERCSLEQRAESLGLSQRVRFHGHQDDPGVFLSQTHLHLFPSRFESCGLVILEAMAHGVPTLAIQADGAGYQNANHEIITTGVDGLIAQNEDDFGRQLARYLRSPQELHPLGCQARKSFLERYQWSTVLDRWEELLCEHFSRQPAGFVPKLSS